jgi:tetratricopeptide (TPR) repeat protein
VLLGAVVLVGRRELASVVPLVALGAATAEFVEAAPWPAAAVQLPGLRAACIALHVAAVGWVLWRGLSGRSSALTLAGVLLVLMSFHETFTEGSGPRHVLTAVRHALAMWSLVWLVGRRSPRARGVVRACAFALLVGAAALPWALNPGSSVAQLLLWLDALALFLLLTLGGQAEGWGRVARMGLAVGVGVALLGMGRLLGWWAGIGAWAAFGYRLKVAGLHENLVASVLAAAVPLLVTQLARRRKAILWLVLPPWTVALILTYSRGGWTAAAAGVAVLLLLRRHRRRWLLPVAAGLAVAVLTLMSPAGRTVGRRLVSATEGLQGRREAWLATGRMILRRPLHGHGWDAGYARARYATSLASSKYLLSHAHNLPLEIAYSYGLLGLAAAGGLWVVGSRGVRTRGPWAIAGAGTTAAIVVHGFVAQPLVCPALVALFLIGLSLACGDTVVWRRSRPRTALVPAWLVLLWAGAAAPILIAVPGTSAASRRLVAPLETEPWQDESNRLRAEGCAREAVSWLRQALRHRRGYPPLLTELGWTLWEAGRVPEAVASMREAHQLDPQGIHGGEHLSPLGYMLLQQGRLADARSVLAAAARREPYGFRKPPWATRTMAAGTIDACLPVREGSQEKLARWLDGSGDCPGLPAMEFIGRARVREPDDYLWLGSAHHCLRRLQEAASVLEDGLRAWPGDGALSFRLAEVYRDGKRWRDEAELCGRSGQFHREAEVRLALGDWEGALDAVERDLAKGEYRLANNYWIRAQALWRLGTPEEAIRWGKKSLFCLFRPERAIQLADWLTAENRSRDACRAYRRVLLHLVRERARRWGTWDWRYTEHVTRLAAALGAAPAAETCPVRGSSVVELVVRSRRAVGEEAVRLASLAARGAPGDPWVWLSRADAQARAGDMHGATESLKHASSSGADPVRLLEREGRLLVAEGHQSDALSAFCQGSALQPRNGRWFVRIWEVFAALGYDRAAVAALREAGRRERDWADPHILLAQWWARRGRLEDSEAEHLSAIRADPYSSWARDSYGRSLLRWLRPHDALAQLEVAAAIEPLASKPLYRMAKAHLALGDTAQAVEHLERTLSLDPTFSAASDLLSAL